MTERTFWKRKISWGEKNHFMGKKWVYEKENGRDITGGIYMK